MKTQAGSLHRMRLVLPHSLPHEKAARTPKGRTMRRVAVAQLQNPTPLVSGRKAARVTRSPDELDGDKETQRRGWGRGWGGGWGGARQVEKEGGRVAFCGGPERKVVPCQWTGLELQLRLEGGSAALRCSVCHSHCRSVCCAIWPSVCAQDCACAYLHVRVCVCPALGTKSDRKGVGDERKAGIFSPYLYVRPCQHRVGWVGERERVVGALCFRKAADWKQWVSLAKPGESARGKKRRADGGREGRKMSGWKKKSGRMAEACWTCQSDKNKDFFS